MPHVVPVPRLSAVNLDSVESVSIGVLVERLGRLSDDPMRQICQALEVAVDWQVMSKCSSATDSSRSIDRHIHERGAPTDREIRLTTGVGSSSQAPSGTGLVRK